MIAKINGAKNCYRVSMVDLDKTSKLDHTVLLVTKNPIKSKVINSKESIIIDPWLGISGQSDKVFTRYKNEFKKMLKLSDDTSIGFKINKSLELDNREIDVLKSIHPELIFTKKDKSQGFMRFG